MNFSIERKKTRLDNFDYSSKEYAYFVTICCKDKRKLLGDGLSGYIADVIEKRNGPDSATIYCYTIMPDHLHVVLRLADGFDGDLMKWVAAFKSYTAKKAKTHFGTQGLWQKNFYDHVVRDPEALSGLVTYVLNNPVRKEMVAEWEDYPFSRLLTLE